MYKTETKNNVNTVNGIKSGNSALTVVPNTEIERIYRAGGVSADSQKYFRTSLGRSLSTQGMTMDQFIESNRKIKVEMQNYLEHYKVQRSLMAAVIYYLKHPELAGVKFTDMLAGVLGRKTQLEAKKIANDPRAIKNLFEEMASSIEQSRNKTYELERHSISLYNASLTQRETIEKDITTLLQKISVNNDKTVKLEVNYDIIKGNMDELLKYMEEELGMDIKNNRPVLDSEQSILLNTSTKDIDDINALPVDKSPNLTKENINTTNENTSTDIETAEDTKVLDKKKIEAIKTYHLINDKLVKSENLLRDAQNEKLVMHQNYERAKENLTLYERVLINQVNEARNYFALLYAIYDAEVKYTLPSARLIAHLASLQEVAITLAQQIYDSRNIFNSLLDNVTQGALEIQEGIIMLAITPSWDPAVLEQSEARTIELKERTKAFTAEMDKRLTEIETIYRDPMKVIHTKDSGVDDKYLQNLLTEK